jgi:hypothetical protein
MNTLAGRALLTVASTLMLVFGCTKFKTPVDGGAGANDALPETPNDRQQGGNTDVATDLFAPPTCNGTCGETGCEAFVCADGALAAGRDRFRSSTDLS